MDFHHKDPCCGFSLYRGAKVIALIDLVTSVFSTVLAGFGFLISVVDGKAILEDVNDFNANANNGTGGFPDNVPTLGVGWLIVSLFTITVINVLYIYLARYLLHSVQERNTVKLQRWFDVTAVILAVRLLGYIPMLFVEGGAVILFGIVWCSYSGYSLWVVYAFKKQLLTEGESNLLRDSVHYSRFHKI